jgi:sulfite reductase (ferredoxin)
MNRGRIIAIIKPSPAKKTMGSPSNKRSPLEALKENSNGLVGAIPEAIVDPSSGTVPEEAEKLMKFHGIYAQLDRDTRLERKKQGLDPEYQFMVRTRLPGGKLTAEQYLLLDGFCDRYGNQTLRVTTRQTIQFHGVLKEHLKPLIHEINQAAITTYGACGDVCRNVMACPVDDLLPGHNWNMQALAEELSLRFLPNSTGYFEVWCDGERFGETVQPDRSEPFYGNTYMPRKYKMGLARAQDNCIDMLTNDVGIEVEGSPSAPPTSFVLNIGGGLGSNHGKKATFPRLAERLGRVSPEQLIPALETIASIQRDFGDRENRRHARMKYLLEDRGLDWFRETFTERAGFTPEPAGPRPPYQVDDHLGWHRQKGEDLWFVGLFIENGRILDDHRVRLRTGLRTILERFPHLEVRNTPQQNLILTHVTDQDRPEIERLLSEYGLRTEKDVSTLRRWAMACVALPTCGLALAESERYLPSLLDEIEQRGYGDNRLWIRMSGCPNACSRSPVAELAIVGRSPGVYALYVGGSFEGTRLATKILDLIKEAQLPDEICRFIDFWHQHRSSPEEAFGDFCHRVGNDALLQWREQATATV